ncbi:MAG: FecR domain-containing protein [Tannerellaceae bacterium]|jgi:ferric-dicitrate binding protein FerR (iron transport regulator)|nr:FecR domain-containing protein [Tannerellaceae bacterium]
MNEQLLIRYLNHQSTAEETKQIFEWISANKENEKWLFETERIWSLKYEMHFSDKKKISRAYQQFVARNKTFPSSKSKKQLIVSWSKYVAAAIITILLVINIFKLQEAQEMSSQMNVIEVPPGQRTSVILSDGTKVWLNAGSKLAYPSNFSSKKRSVSLEGEGFFEVVRSEETPFVVHVPLLNVTVLGTMFNVKAYKDEITEVVLERGKIEITIHTDPENPILMNPNDQVLYSVESGLTVNRSLHASTIKKWIIGETYFYNQPLKNIIKELERRFNRPIIIRDKELEGELFNCHTQPDATLIQIMNLLKETRRIDYFQNEREIIVFNPKK